jgi:hypothetical protein
MLKILPPQGFDRWTLQSVAIRYIDRAILTHPYLTDINTLTPELNPSAQRCLMSFTGDFAS